MASPTPPTGQYTSVSTPVPFPQPEGVQDPNATSNPTADSPQTRQRTSTNASNVSNRIRTASIKLMEAAPPAGMWAATGATVSKAPSLVDIRRGSFGSDGWNEEQQRRRAGSRTSQGEERSTPAAPGDATRPYNGLRKGSGNNAMGSEPFPALTEEETQHIPRYDGQDKTGNAAYEQKTSSDTAEHIDGDGMHHPKRTSSGGVSPVPPKLGVSLWRDRRYRSLRNARFPSCARS